MIATTWLLRLTGIHMPDHVRSEDHKSLPSEPPARPDQGAIVMAVVTINKDQNWGCAAYVFDNILSRAAQRIAPSNLGLAKELGLAVESHLNWYSLEELSAEDFRLFLHTIKEIQGQYLADGPSAFADPTFYPGFIARIEDFLKLLTSDQRCQ